MKRILFLRAGILWLSLLVFMSLTKPYDMAVSLLILPFILFGLAMFASWQAFAQLADKSKRAKESIRVRLLGIVISIIATFALGLESLGELTPKDFFVVAMFGLVAYFYMIRSVKPS